MSPLLLSKRAQRKARQAAAIGVAVSTPAPMDATTPDNAAVVLISKPIALPSGGIAHVHHGKVVPVADATVVVPALAPDNAAVVLPPPLPAGIPVAGRRIGGTIEKNDSGPLVVPVVPAVSYKALRPTCKRGMLLADLRSAGGITMDVACNRYAWLARDFADALRLLARVNGVSTVRGDDGHWRIAR